MAKQITNTPLKRIAGKNAKPKGGVVREPYDVYKCGGMVRGKKEKKK